MPPHERRRNPLVAPKSLSSTLLEERGIVRRQRRRVRTRGVVPYTGTVERLRVELADGRSGSPEPSCLIAPVEPSEPLPSQATATDPRREVRWEWDGTTLRAQVGFPRGTTFHGLGLVCGPLAHRGRRVVLWNTDAWRYGDRTEALYQSHPWVLAVGPDGGATGVLADSTCRGEVRTFEDGLELCFEDEPFDLYLVEAAHPEDCLGALGDLVGTAPLPPLWALGYHQCRWGYHSAAEVQEVARRLREQRVPCDAVWLDIDHMDRHRALTFDPERFADPAGLVAELDQLGLHTVAIVDPGLHAVEDCELFLQAREGEHLIALADGAPAVGRVWPGVCAFPDFTGADTRDFWAAAVRAFVESSGLAGLWCDMNEPAVHRTPPRTLPEHARHAGFGGGSHRRFHNVYGHLMVAATREGLAAARPDRRPFVLTRAGHLATAGLAACWTGDNQSTWRDLRWSIPMVLNLGLSGQPFAGADIGGFEGDPSPELFARWFELGALLPFCRGHSQRDAGAKEPWVFGDEILGRVRAALELRMRLLPYLYTLFEEAERSGVPVARPLFLADPQDAALRDADDAFLLGRDLLVAPATEAGARRRKLRLPRGGWYPLDRASPGARSSALHGEVTLPVLPTGPALLARAGSILPLGNTRASTRDPLRELTLHVHPDEHGHATGRLYEDAGEGYEHRRGGHRRTHWEARREDNGLVVDTIHEGHFEPPPRSLRVQVAGADSPYPIRFLEANP